MKHDIPMKTMPSVCPICGDPLVVEHYSNGPKRVDVRKDCIKRLDHWIRFIGPDNEWNTYEEVTVAISRDPLLRAMFSYRDNQVIVLPGTIEEIIKNRLDEHPTIIPFFEPDLTDYKALISKLKTYLVFS